MPAVWLAKLLSPRVILGILVALLIGVAGLTIYNAIKNYVAVEKQNVVLTDNLTTSNAALATEKQAAATQQTLAAQKLDDLRNYVAQQTAFTANSVTDNQALQVLGAPTNDDFQCVKSRYVSTILNQLRNRQAGSTAGASPSGSDAGPTSGAAVPTP